MKRITLHFLLAVTLGLVVTVAGLLCPAPAEATESVLDQSHTGQNSLGMIGTSGGTGEVFTAGKSGYLNRVSLYLGLPASGATTGGVNVNIEMVTSDGLPSGTRVGHGSIPVEEISTTGGWVDVDIDGAFVTAGTQYVLIPSTGNGTVSWYMENGGDVKPYPAGYWVSEAGGAWHKILTNQDWTFNGASAPASSPT